MDYRIMEKLGVSPSLLGFGCMRLPQKDGKIDQALAESMVDKAIAEGVNYVDTAYPYHNGESEPFVGRVIKKYDRKKLFIATKLPMWKLEKEEDVEHIFAEQLQRLDTPYIDFYLLHAMNGERIETMEKFHIIDKIRKFRDEGKIRFIGFSFHDKYEAFEKLVNMKIFDFCQIHLNYMDTEHQAGLKGAELARQAGMPLVIMEPVKGGSLASLPDEITAGFRQVDPNASTASWALRFVGSVPGVKAILSGMTTMEQVEDNLKTFKSFKPLNDAEQKLIKETAEKIRSRIKVNCTACKYCMPCPQGVDIPRNFHILNDYSMYGNKGGALFSYFKDMDEKERASSCIKCGKCETLCPQGINIRDCLAETAALMESIKE
jgi:predicted aldo/keto reductase-like oxidoreductase